MEEGKAAAYYDEITRKGEGAARFKQGLGFSSASRNRDDVVPARGSGLPSSSSSFLSSFVRASSPTKAAEFQKQAQLETIQNKLKKKSLNASETQQSSRVSTDTRRSSSGEKDRDPHSRRRSGSGDRRGLSHRHRSSSRDGDRDRYGEKARDRERRTRRRSRSRSVSDEDRRRRTDIRRSRSVSPRDRRREKSGSDRSKDKGAGKVGKERNGAIDYAKLIEGYDKMSPSERVKAKMKVQLSETAEKDAIKGMGSGWERFEFNKDAPLDDEEIEAAEDDAALVKHICQSFRFSAVETRREEQIKAAHDKAMFGASSIAQSFNTEDEIEQNSKKESNESAAATGFISDKVIAKQQGSWRDRARKV